MTSLQRVLVLAAGQSRRFGSDKRLALLAASRAAPSQHAEGLSPTVLEATLARLAGLHWPVQLLLRADDQALSEQLSERAPNLGLSAWLPPLLVKDAAAGQGHTLAAGVRQAEGDGVTHLLIALGDMPYLRPATLSRIAGQLSQQAADKLTVVRPRSAAGPGNPVAFTRAAFPELMQLTGDQGARTLLLAWQTQTIWLCTEDPGIHQDIDRPEDLGP